MEFTYIKKELKKNDGRKTKYEKIDYKVNKLKK